jgi:hypothetical protein
MFSLFLLTRRFYRPVWIYLGTKSLPKPIIYNIPKWQHNEALHHPVEQRTRKTEVQNKQFMKVIFQMVHSL